MSDLLEALRANSDKTAEAIRRKVAMKAKKEAVRTAEKPVVIFMRLHVPMGHRPKRDSEQKAVALRSN